MRKEKGFSLIELLIVVAIIIIIAAIAVPSLLEARKSANESAAVASLRSLASAEYTYASRNNQQYGKLADLVAGGYVDNRFPGRVNGYDFSENVAVPGLPPGTPTNPPEGFGFGAKPGAAHLGTYDFAVGPDGVVRYWEKAPAGVSSGDPVGKASSGG